MPRAKSRKPMIAEQETPSDARAYLAEERIAYYRRRLEGRRLWRVGEVAYLIQHPRDLEFDLGLRDDQPELSVPELLGYEVREPFPEEYPADHPIVSWLRSEMDLWIRASGEDGIEGHWENDIACVDGRDAVKLAIRRFPDWAERWRGRMDTELDFVYAPRTEVEAEDEKHLEYFIPCTLQEKIFGEVLNQEHLRKEMRTLVEAGSGGKRPKEVDERVQAMYGARQEFKKADIGRVFEALDLGTFGAGCGRASRQFRGRDHVPRHEVVAWLADQTQAPPRRPRDFDDDDFRVGT